MGEELLKAGFIFTAALGIFLINSDFLPRLSQSIKKIVFSPRKFDNK